MSAHNRIVWQGLPELIAAMRQLPAELRDEGGSIVSEHATAVSQEIAAKYPIGETGNLHDGMSVNAVTTSARFGVRYTVRNRSPHAWWYDHGTQVRRSAFGNRGSMPAQATFVPAIIKKKREMYERLKALVERHGLKVSGDA